MQISDEDFVKQVGIRIRKLRVDKGYTSYERFAIEFDIDRKYYWEVEKGRNVTIIYLLKLLKIHNLSLEEFFKDFK